MFGDALAEYATVCVSFVSASKILSNTNTTSSWHYKKQIALLRHCSSNKTHSNDNFLTCLGTNQQRVTMELTEINVSVAN